LITIGLSNILQQKEIIDARSLLQNYTIAETKSIAKTMDRDYKSLIRMRDRVSYTSPIVLKTWQNDAEKYIESINGFRAILLTDNNGLILISATNSQVSSVDALSVETALKCVSDYKKTAGNDIAQVISNKNISSLCYVLPVTINQQSGFLIPIINLTQYIDNIYQADIKKGFGIDLAYNGASIYENNQSNLLRNNWTTHSNLDFLNLKLEFSVWPNQVILDGYTTKTSLYALIFGILASFLFALLVNLYQVSRRNIVIAQRIESSFKSLFEETLEYAIITLDLNGKVTSWNKGAEKIKGYLANEIIGRHYAIFLPSKDRDINILNSKLEKVKKEHTVNDEGWRVRKDGTKFYASETFSPIYSSVGMLSGYSIITKDLTKLKVHEDKIKGLNNKLSAILNSSNLSIITTDSRGIINTFSRSAEKLLGYTAEEIIGKHTPDIFHDPVELNYRSSELSKLLKRQIKPGLETFTATLSTEKVDENDWTYLTKFGNRIPVIVSVTSLMDSDGIINGYLMMALDITERKECEKIKNELVSMVSHELRTPLTSIHGSLTLLSAEIPGKQDSDALSLINIALNNSDRLIRLINNMLDMDKMESGKMHYQYSLTSAASVINEAIKSNLPYAQKFKIKLISLINILPEVVINIDQDKLLQAITNLISNAVKFSPEESSVTVITTRNGDKICIEIRDSGCGIPDEFQKNIFQRFSQADSSSSRKQQGSGLGLNISKKMIDVMGGSLYFKSSCDSGTSFFIELPIYNGSYVERAIVSSKPHYRINNKYILHIEDDRDLHSIIKSILQLEYNIDNARTVESARKMVQQKKYDLIILDVKLPDGESTELMDEINKLNIPVIVLTAYDNLPIYSKFVEAILVKSKTPNSTIVSVIDAAVNNKKYTKEDTNA
jgi:PAS domain S-box-containing protein